MSNVNPSFIADAFEKAVNIGAKHSYAGFVPSVVDLAPTEKKLCAMQRLSPTGDAEVIEWERPRSPMSVIMATLDSFVDFLAKPHGTLANAGVPIVTVERDAVVARYNPDGYFERHVVRMPLDYSEAYSALREIMGMPATDRLPSEIVRTLQGFLAMHRPDFAVSPDEENALNAVDQIVQTAKRMTGAKGAGVMHKRLWELLATDLRGCFPEQYEFLISEIRLAEKRSTHVDIHPTGLRGENISGSVELVFKTSDGDEPARLDTDWTYVGPIFTCYDLKTEIPCRLVIDNERGLEFKLCPRGLEAILLEYRAALSNELVSRLEEAGASIPVYEGLLCSGA